MRCPECGTSTLAIAATCSACGYQFVPQGWGGPDLGGFSFDQLFAQLKAEQDKADRERYGDRRRAREANKVPCIGGPFHEKTLEEVGLVVAVKTENGLPTFGVQPADENECWVREKEQCHTYRLMTDMQTGEKCYVHIGTTDVTRYNPAKKVRIPRDKLESGGSPGDR